MKKRKIGRIAEAVIVTANILIFAVLVFVNLRTGDDTLVNVLFESEAIDETPAEANESEVNSVKSELTGNVESVNAADSPNESYVNSYDASEGSSSEVLEESGLININTASYSQLQTLTGIGEVKAQAIIGYRETHGAFTSVDQLINVSGIGEKTLENIRDKITV